MFWGGNNDPNNSQLPFSLLETCPQTIQFNYPKAKGIRSLSAGTHKSLASRVLGPPGGVTTTGRW